MPQTSALEYRLTFSFRATESTNVYSTALLTAEVALCFIYYFFSLINNKNDKHVNVQ